MTTRISPNFRQQILCPQQVSVNTTLTGMDAYKVWTHTVVGTITFTLPAAKKGAGPMYFCEQGATNIIVVQPQSTDLIVGNGVGVPVTLNTTGAFFGVFCEIDGIWSVISASPGVAGAGTVSSVGLADGSATPIYNISGSPVTTAGTLTFTFKTQTANTVLAGPTSGGVAQPTFRALVAADVPSSILPGGFTGFAIPANLISLAANSAGVATTAIRSDATIQLDVSISPTWTGNHIFAGAGSEKARFTGVASPFISFYNAAQTTRTGFIQGISGVAGSGGGLELELALDGNTSADRLSFATNGARRGYVQGDGRWIFNAPSTNQALSILTAGYVFGNATDNPTYSFLGTGAGAIAGTWTYSGPVNNYGIRINGSATSGQSYGLSIAAGTTAADVPLIVTNQAASATFLEIFGDGHGILGASATLGLSWDASGNLTASKNLTVTGLTTPAGGLIQTHTPGTHTIPTGYFGLYIDNFTLTGVQQLVLAGTARLRIL